MDSGKKGYLLFKWLILINVYISIFYFLCLNYVNKNIRLRITGSDLCRAA